ncbi:MAG TPA: terpene cyclase/mutase family protein [Phycisphaerae bacterium]|jgi:squalene-hopene/tetraprenyl-beta-curcumene cyclase|nr:terpene cyclase/mutase family protein [Phycisphaerae bacterium]HOB72968.1 terpene cyclase/mutase family protein [Phycisphaerae bacterium]HOJ52983.1 terpene cyclase/mutase family protein [Phycisphaerae bacterium]HOL24720.1 terpene cyclase/mutase family protein [Phycisphaerae bacterium]HPP19256.1 terpene cyclase/mutase family protein [Phycisphaerae bacterium]
MSWLGNRTTSVPVILCTFVTFGSLTATLFAEPATTRPAGVDRETLRRKVAPAIQKGLRFLENAQAPDGGWKGGPQGTDPAITAMAAKAFIQDPAYGPKHPVVRRALTLVLKFQQPDGGIYDPRAGYANYSTSVVLMMLAALKDPALDKPIAAAQDFLKGKQWDESKTDPQDQPVEISHAWYGGAGYGEKKTRPDLSNTQMMIEALHESGLPPSDPAYKKAMCFISRCQMLSETNDQPFAQGAQDGGFIYSPANNGESKAGTITVGEKNFLRSYGSMTYAGFKSMIYANVDRQDPRVQAAWNWIRRYYTLEHNPNMPGAQSKQGLFYYYHTFAKALRAWGEPVIVDEKNVHHDWRMDLAEHILKQQKPDGSWVNSADRWMEGNPYLVTSYSLLALQEAIRDDR